MQTCELLREDPYTEPCGRCSACQANTLEQLAREERDQLRRIETVMLNIAAKLDLLLEREKSK